MKNMKWIGKKFVACGASLAALLLMFVAGSCLTTSTGSSENTKQLAASDGTTAEIVDSLIAEMEQEEEQIPKKKLVVKVDNTGGMTETDSWVPDALRISMRTYLAQYTDGSDLVVVNDSRDIDEIRKAIETEGHYAEEQIQDYTESTVPDYAVLITVQKRSSTYAVTAEVSNLQTREAVGGSSHTATYTLKEIENERAARSAAKNILQGLGVSLSPEQISQLDTSTTEQAAAVYAAKAEAERKAGNDMLAAVYMTEALQNPADSFVREDMQILEQTISSFTMGNSLVEDMRAKQELHKKIQKNIEDFYQLAKDNIDNDDIFIILTEPQILRSSWGSNSITVGFSVGIGSTFDLRDAYRILESQVKQAESLLETNIYIDKRKLYRNTKYGVELELLQKDGTPFYIGTGSRRGEPARITETLHIDNSVPGCLLPFFRIRDARHISFPRFFSMEVAYNDRRQSVQYCEIDLRADDDVDFNSITVKVREMFFSSDDSTALFKKFDKYKVVSVTEWNKLYARLIASQRKLKPELTETENLAAWEKLINSWARPEKHFDPYSPSDIFARYRDNNFDGALNIEYRHLPKMLDQL